MTKTGLTEVTTDTTDHGSQSFRPNVNSPDQLAPPGASNNADNQLAPLWHNELASLACL